MVKFSAISNPKMSVSLSVFLFNHIYVNVNCLVYTCKHILTKHYKQLQKLFKKDKILTYFLTKMFRKIPERESHSRQLFQGDPARHQRATSNQPQHNHMS